MKHKTKKIKQILLAGCVLVGNFAMASVTIKELEFSKSDAGSGVLLISYQGTLDNQPELMVRDAIIQVELKDASVWPKIEKKVSLVDNNLDTTLMAYQFDKKMVRVRAVLPYISTTNNDEVKMEVGKDKIMLHFPIIKMKGDNTASTKANPMKYDESYLEQLLKDKSEKSDKANAKEAIKNDFENVLVDKNAVKDDKNDSKLVTDQVKNKLSAVRKNEGWQSGFSIQNFIAKVVAFFAVILLGFYAVVTMIRKGVFKKTRLGFLSSEKMVEVLSTTYIAPKRSIMMIRAHDQVFLVGNSEKGMHFISEVKNVPGLLKTGEKSITGNNFDTSLVDADVSDIPQMLKENIEESKEEISTLSSFLNGKKSVQEKEKFSEKIKSKVKNMKSLQ